MVEYIYDFMLKYGHTIKYDNTPRKKKIMVDILRDCKGEETNTLHKNKKKILSIFQKGLGPMVIFFF